MIDEPTTPAPPSADFVFGTLATDALRLTRLRAERSGVAHGQRLTPPDPSPEEPVLVHVSTGPQVAATQVTCYYTTDGSEPQGAHGVAQQGQAVALTRVGVVWDTLLWGYRSQWAGTIPAQPQGTLVRYRLEAWAPNGPSQWASEITDGRTGEAPAGGDPGDDAPADGPAQVPWPLVRRARSYAYHVDEERVPAWLRDAVIYHIFVDRFAPGTGNTFAAPATPGGFYGGTLRGISEQLDYLADLGVTCLWLSPVFPSPSHHGYDATDYATVEPRLGTLADLRTLTAAAHARGLRVLLDYVANHVSSRHPAFQAALAQPDAPETRWFTFRRWPDQYLTFFGVQDHPQIDSEHPAAAAYLIDHARFWLTHGIDGFRLDYANGPSHAFWSAFRAATRAVAHESVTVGEVVETPALQRSYAGRMDGCLDFVLLQALRQFFAFGTLRPAGFDAFLRQHLAYFPADFVLPTFLDNHDMNRFLWVVGGDTRRLKLAALCQFTLPHPPILYYGTEVGLGQRRDVRARDGSGHPEEARLPMLWGTAQDRGLQAYYQALIGLRRAYQPLWRGERTTVLTDDARGLYGYRCASEGSSVVVVLNASGQTHGIGLPTPHAYQMVLTSAAEAQWDGAELRLPPWGGVILRSTGR